MHDTMKVLLISLMTLTAFVEPAHASETITCTYDALGRLVQVVHSGTVNNNLNTAYNLDKADNRVNVTVTGGS